MRVNKILSEGHVNFEIKAYLYMILKRLIYQVNQHLSFSNFQALFVWLIIHSTLMNRHCGQNCPTRIGSVHKRLFQVSSAFNQLGTVKIVVMIIGINKKAPNCGSLIHLSILILPLDKSWHSGISNNICTLGLVYINT